LFSVATFGDPLKKREEFSVSLRKQKKSEIIMSKRKRKLEESPVSSKDESANMRDDSTTKLEALQTELEALMALVVSLVPPEYAEAEWVSLHTFLSYTLECERVVSLAKSSHSTRRGAHSKKLSEETCRDQIYTPLHD
jgi:transcriptional regulatory protein LevR